MRLKMLHISTLVLITLTLSACGGGGGSASDQVAAKKIISLLSSAHTSIALGEGATITYTIRLTAVPDADITVDLSSDDTDVFTISPSALTFTSANWNVDQTVTLTGVEDNDILDGDANAVATSAQLPGETLTIPVHVTDNDTMTIVASTASIKIGENQTTQMTVQLSAQPASDIVVNVASLDTSIASVGTSTLTFTHDNWNTAQSFDVNGVDDANTTDDSTTIRLTATSVPTKDVAITVYDDDNSGPFSIIVGSNPIYLWEGDNITVPIHLSGRPSGAFMINLYSYSVSVAQISPATMVFTPDNWFLDQQVHIRGVVDGNSNADVSNLELIYYDYTTEIMYIPMIVQDKYF